MERNERIEHRRENKAGTPERGVTWISLSFFRIWDGSPEEKRKARLRFSFDWKIRSVRTYAGVIGRFLSIFLRRSTISSFSADC